MFTIQLLFTQGEGTGKGGEEAQGFPELHSALWESIGGLLY